MSAALDTLRRLFALGSAPPPAPARPAVEKGLAARLYLERRRRAAFFADGMFWEPSWDLLLYLYDAWEQGQARVPLYKAANACEAVSGASADRWIELLMRQGYLATQDRSGGEGSGYLALTAKGREAMTGYLAGATPEAHFA